MINWKETLLSQYCDSPTLDALLSSYNDAIDPSTDIANFYYNIWNVNTASGQGLDDWGQIVNVSRYLQIPNSPNYLGYEEAYLAPYATTGPQTFNNAPFYTQAQATTTFALQDDDYRELILLKAFVNISNLSVPAINTMLRMFFGVYDDDDPYGVAYVIDTFGMGFTYHFNFIPNDLQLAIVNNSGVFPRPAGMLVTVTY